MKKTNVLYWVFTGLFAAAMLFSSIGNVMMDDASVQLINGYLAFPKYMIPFLGVAKILGVIGILIPTLPRWIKEWSYAGLFFDLAGATYAVISVAGFHVNQIGMLMFFIPGILSYIYFHKKFGSA
ncbi:MAG TPA: DoxX family protein [Chryseosolibacter sp.]